MLRNQTKNGIDKVKKEVAGWHVQKGIIFLVMFGILPIAVTKKNFCLSLIGTGEDGLNGCLNQKKKIWDKYS
jgi:hypothetical protein